MEEIGWAIIGLTVWVTVDCCYYYFIIIIVSLQESPVSCFSSSSDLRQVVATSHAWTYFSLLQCLWLYDTTLTGMYLLLLKGFFQSTNLFFFSFWHSSLFLYFWTCTIMASSCRSKVELHLFSYVGAVIQKLPQHLSLTAARRPLRLVAFSERLAAPEREAGSAWEQK